MYIYSVHIFMHVLGWFVNILLPALLHICTYTVRDEDVDAFLTFYE